MKALISGDLHIEMVKESQERSLHLHAPKRIISGGQTGADRGGLDFAIEAGIEHGGFCPKGRVAEDGVIPATYRLLETESSEYPPRTRKNVASADATVIFVPGCALSRGSELTACCCREQGKPHVILCAFPIASKDVAQLRAFLAEHRPHILNVAGNRESKTPGICAHVMHVLSAALTEEKGE